MLPIETDLSKIEKLSIQKENENFKFRAFLRGLDPSEVDRVVHRLNRKVSRAIDCTECGNCCHSLVPGVTEVEITRLAALDNITKEEFDSRHLEDDKFAGTKFLKAIPCRYLEGKICSIYDMRPNECRSYPHLHKKGFVYRTLSVISNYGICPIVFNVMENLKIETNFKSQSGT